MKSNRRWPRVLLVLGLLAAGVAIPVGPASAQIPPEPNPTIDDSCGIDVTLVLDASGSIQSSNAVGAVRDAGKAFLSALADTNSTARVLDFGSVARETAPTTAVTAASVAPGGIHADALQDYYNPKPPFILGAVGREYKGSGDPLSASSWKAPNNKTEYTNWDQALDLAGDGTPPELVVFVTDGDPTAYDFNEPGDPFLSAGQPPDVGWHTDRGQAAAVTLDRAVAEANLVKAVGGSRILTVGVGAALQNPASVTRLTQVSGPSVARSPAEFIQLGINGTDVALVRDFNALAQALRSIVTQLCSPSLTITKQAQTPGSAQYTPAAGWEMTVTPTVTGGTYRWILPDTAAAPSKTQATGANGVAQFQWEPDPPTLNSTATVSEALQPGYIPVDYRCERRNPNGSVEVSEGALTGSPPTFTVPVGAEQIVTCTLRNRYDYQPDIDVTKVNSPTEVRGDLTPPAPVTSTYAVTNPGNTPLGSIVVTDDQCAPVTAVSSAPGVNVGDANADGRLDTTETWQYTCVRPITQSLTTSPVNIINTVTATGTDPAGTTVTATATDDVDVITPAITLDKQVAAPGGTPSDAVTVTAGTTVTYTYTVTNGGNVALSPVVLADDTPPCTSPTFAGGDTNGDAALDLTETWTYTCSAPVSQAVVNTATVTGTPVRPVGNVGPPVTATDFATVDTVDPELELTKTVDQRLVFPGTRVTYTYVAENNGTADLRNPADPAGAPNRATPWVVDNRCSPVTYASGDDDNDNLLNPGEAWTFTCSTEITRLTVNLATIDAVTVAPTPVRLIRTAVAVVNVAEPSISIVKTALRGVVLDASLSGGTSPAPVTGPDVPTPRAAQYAYEVTNTGGLPLADVAARLTDDKCSGLIGPIVDSNSNSLLDVDETWSFICSTPLTKADGSAPTQPISSLVTNTASVTGTPLLSGEPRPERDVSATDIAQVLVIKPDLTLTKTASAGLVRPGESVTYTYSSTNTGDVGLRPVAFADDLCSPVVNITGDANGNGLIDGANSGAPETWSATCTTAPAANAALDPVTNTAQLSVIDPLGNTFVRTAQATVQFFLADIGLSKTVSDELVLNGSTVTYTFEVTNEGTSPVVANDVLSNVILADVSEPPTPSCASPAFVGGDTNGDGRLDLTEIWTYECSAVITADTTNVAIVGGIDILGGAVLDADAAFTGPFTPAIEVAKTAVPTSLLGGGPVTYTYNVRNTGDVPLADVVDRIADDTCSPVTYVSGDIDGDGLLDTPNDIFEQAEDEVWVFTCTTDVSRDTTNTVTVTGTPVDPLGTPLCVTTPCDVTATAVASVQVVAPGSITIVKSAAPAGSTAFAFTGSLGDFSLVGDGSAASRTTTDGLQPGTYAVTESVPRGWELTAVSCVDPSGDSRGDVRGRTATISLAAGESVTCTFSNAVSGVGVATTGFGFDGPLRLAVLMLVAGTAMVVAASRIRREATA